MPFFSTTDAPEQRLKAIVAANSSSPMGCADAFAYLASARNEKRLAAGKLLLCRQNAYWNRVNGRNHCAATARKLAEVAAHRLAATTNRVIETIGTVHVVTDRRHAA